MSYNGVRILVADADQDEMDRTSDILRSAGYHVHKAAAAPDALSAVRGEQFDLAVIDVQLAGQHHGVLLDYLTQAGALPWIAMANEANLLSLELGGNGPAALVRRPVERDVLLARVHRVLKGQVAPAPTATLAQEQGGAMLSALERRLVEQQTLSQLARSLSAVLDLDILLKQVVDAAVRLSNAEEGMLLLPDDEGEALHVRAVRGLDTETARNFRIKTEDTLAGQVYLSGMPVLVGDQGPQKLKTEYLVKSLLYVPLSIKGTVIGVLGVNNKHASRTFTQDDRELLENLAAHAAVAIENARLYEDSVQRTHELSTLVEVGEAANSTLAIDEVLSIIAMRLIGALGANQCYIAEWLPDAGRLRMLAVSYRALWRPSTGPVLDVADHPAIKQAFAQKRLITAEAPPFDAGTALWQPQHAYARAVQYLPLMVQDQLLGTVVFYRLRSQQQAPPPSSDGRLLLLGLEMTAALAASDFREHSRFYELAEQMLQITDTDWCEVALWHPNRREFNIMLSSGELIWHDGEKPEVDLAPLEPLSRLLATQTPMAGSLASDSLRPLAGLGHGRSVLGVPLVIKGAAAGLVLLVDTLSDRQFQTRDIELVQALTSQAANALDNARLYRDLQMSLEELHRAQSRLVQAARLTAMGELAAAVAHQINNPLTTILGDAQLILQDLAPEDPNREPLEAIFRAGKRADEVARRLLTMARQRPPVERLSPVDLNDTITNTLMLVKGHMQQGRVAVSVSLQDDLPLVRALEGQLEDVWLNLLLNARDAVAARTKPQIGVESAFDAASDQVAVVIWDNGTGIPTSIQQQIFDPFFTTKAPGEGTGLGLHICQQIVAASGGSIRVQSTPSEGTRFTVSLPLYYE